VLLLAFALAAVWPAYAQDDAPEADEPIEAEAAPDEIAEAGLGEAIQYAQPGGFLPPHRNLSRVVTPMRREQFNFLPVHIEVAFRKAADAGTFQAWLNKQEITHLFQPLVNGSRVTTLTLDDGLLKTGRNILRTHVHNGKGHHDDDVRVFFVTESTTYRPDYLQHVRRLGARGTQLTFSPNGYSGSQANTRQNFGYGMYIVTGWSSPEAVISSWFLDAIQPDATNYPGLSDLWRWSEIDWEFVPQTVSPQREQVVVTGTLPSPDTNIYRSDYLASCESLPGQYDDNTLAQAVTYFWNKGGQTRTPGDPTSVTPNTQITVSTFAELTATAQVPTTPVPYGFTLNPNYPGSGPQYWWTQEYPSFVSTWPLPCNLPLPPAQNLSTSVAINVFRMPPGSLVTTGSGLTSTVIPDIDQSQLPTAQPKPGNVTNETFVWAVDGGGQPTFDPSTGWYTYTIVVAPSFIAFYVNAGADGTDIENSTPVRKLDMNDAQNPYPSLSAFGPAMVGGDLTFQDYYTAPQPMGNLRFMLQNWVDGNGWSGSQPPANPAYAYARSMSFLPLNNGATGNSNSDYGAPTFDIDFTTWTAENANYNLLQNFHLLLAGNASFSNTQTTSPGLVTWATAPDGTPALSLGLTPIADVPPANFYLLAPGGAQGQPSTYVAAEIDVPGQTYSTAAFPQTDAFYGPTGVPITITVWYVDNPSQTCTATIMLQDSASLPWVTNEASGACQPVLPPAGQGTGTNTIGLGPPNF
jgi:hypothetical protein